MTKARIYRAEKSAMQSGLAKQTWMLDFAPEKPYFVENLMGWTGMTDMKQELHMHFPSCEAAVAYAKRNKIPYEVTLPQARRKIRRAYADNFAANKVNG